MLFKNLMSKSKIFKNTEFTKILQLVKEIGELGDHEIIVLAVTKNGHIVEGTDSLKTVVTNLKSTINKEFREMAYKNGKVEYKISKDTIKSIKVPVYEMTVRQLKSLIPKLIKITTGRPYPGWEESFFQPPWWPKDIPFKNVKCDFREKENKLCSFKTILCKIVASCYLYLGREDLVFRESKIGGEVAMKEKIFSNETKSIEGEDGREECEEYDKIIAEFRHFNSAKDIDNLNKILNSSSESNTNMESSTIEDGASVMKSSESTDLYPNLSSEVEPMIDLQTETLNMDETIIENSVVNSPAMCNSLNRLVSVPSVQDIDFNTVSTPTIIKESPNNGPYEVAAELLIDNMNNISVSSTYDSDMDIDDFITELINQSSQNNISVSSTYDIDMDVDDFITELIDQSSQNEGAIFEDIFDEVLGANNEDIFET